MRASSDTSPSRPSCRAATTASPTPPLVQREDGALYGALWNQALADNPDWVLLLSFNQWHNGTEIELSVEMGDLYLRLTADNAARFKAQTVK